MANVSRFGKETRRNVDENAKDQKPLRATFAQPFAHWKTITEKRRSFTIKREEKHRAKVLRAVFLSWKRAAEDSRNRLALTEKFIAQKYRKQQTQLRKDCLLAWNAHAQMLKQTRVEQMKRAVVERAIADESETHYGTPEGIAIVQAAETFSEAKLSRARREPRVPKMARGKREEK